MRVSLQSTKPFSSYNGLKMNKEILKPVGKCLSRVFEFPNNAENDITLITNSRGNAVCRYFPKIQKM